MIDLGDDVARHADPARGSPVSTRTPRAARPAQGVSEPEEERVKGGRAFFSLCVFCGIEGGKGREGEGRGRQRSEVSHPPPCRERHRH